jgi:hypothetical protein
MPAVVTRTPSAPATENGYGAGADLDSDEIDRPTDSAINFSARSSRDCSSPKHGWGNSPSVGTTAMSSRNRVMKMGINESRKSRAGDAMETPMQLS